MKYVIQDLKHRYYRYTSKGVQWHIDINKATVFDSRRAAKITLSRVGNGETLFLVPVLIVMSPDLVTVHGTRRRK